MKELRPHQTAAHEGLRAGFRSGKRRGLLVIPTGGGKCLGRGTLVLMFDGTVKAVEDVAVGELLMGPDSTPRRVLSLARGREMLYRVTPVKGEPYTVNESHILSVKLTPDRPGMAPKVVNLSVLEYLAASLTFRHRAKGWRTGVEFPAQAVEIDPYFLGLWLGDGRARQTHISKPDPEVLVSVQATAHRWGMMVRQPNTTGCPTYAITRGRLGNGAYVNPLKAAFRRLGLMPAKFVPHIYKANSREVRLAVLAGLLDADGSLTHSGFDYVSKERRLAEDVCFLARSLGLAAYLTPCRKGCQNGFVGDYFRVSVSGDCSVIPNRIPRRKALPRRQVKDVLVTGISVESVGDGDYFGFELDGDRLFLLGDFTVTHNTITALEMLRLGAENGTRGLFLCDRRILVSQAASEAREYGIRCGTVMADAGPANYDPHAPVQFASKDTLLSRDLCPDAGLVIVDEAHRSLSEYWAALLDRYPRAWVVGLTATPARADGKGLGRRYEFLVQPTNYSQLISSGVLAPAKCYAPGSRVLGKKARKPTRAGMIGDVVAWWEKLAKGRRTFVFASSVAHSLALRDEFRSRGIPAEHLDGNTPDPERDLVLGKGGKLATGETLVVTSCSVLKYGVDVPAVECVQIADGFASLVDYLQACGRGLRASPGKADCVVIDHSGAVLFHGFPDADRQWVLTEDTDHAADYRKQMACGEAPKPFACPECFALFSGRPDCPGCGWRPKPRGREVGTAKGTLHKVEREAAYSFTCEDYRRGWTQCVAQCHHTGKSLSAAAAIFKKRFGVTPWEAKAAPLPHAGYNWHTPATVWWEKAFARQVKGADRPHLDLDSSS